MRLLPTKYWKKSPNGGKFTFPVTPLTSIHSDSGTGSSLHGTIDHRKGPADPGACSRTAIHLESLPNTPAKEMDSFGCSSHCRSLPVATSSSRIVFLRLG